jgi:hypothetical protein
MSGDDGRPDYLDREKKSFSELDRARRERRDRGEERPRSPASRAGAERATQQYLNHADSLFSGGKRGDAEKLAAAVLDARGTPELAAACRAYVDRAGPPTALRLVSCFLDAGERELVLAGLAALEAVHAAGELEARAGWKTQLRGLAQDSDDEVAGRSEDLLDGL